MKRNTRLVYNYPGAKVEGVKDAFDIAVDEVLKRVERIRNKELAVEVEDEQKAWKYKPGVEANETHEWNHFFPFLWRPSPGLVYIGDAKDEIVEWPANRVVTCMKENYNGENVSKTNSSEIKCVLYDWDGSEELVAEGRVYSSDANHIINGVPLGPNAMIVWVDNPKKQDTYLWRLIVGMTCIGEAVGKKIVWPESKLGFEQVNNTVAPNPTNDNATSPMSANSMVNNKCKLIDVCGTGMVVAEGTVSSTNPESLVHSVPLGKDAARVWVENVKVKNAPLWRTSSVFGCMEDAIGSTVAWPIANIRMDSVCSSILYYMPHLSFN